jgi:nitrogen fixation protein FixH
MKRPVQAGHDLIVRMEEQGNGHYLADVVLPFSGQWDVALTIRARDAIYRRSERVVLPLMEQ